MNNLYQMLQSRTTPENVARELMTLLSLTPQEHRVLERAAASKRWRWSMNDDFVRHTSHIDRQWKIVPLLFAVSETAARTPTVASLRASIGLTDGKKTLTKRERRAAGIYKNARWFNKRRRLLNTLEQKGAAIVANEELYTFTRISKAALSVEIPRNVFDADLNTAALVTYLAAKMNRRSVFTNKPQDRAFDTVAEMLLNRCQNSETTRWFAIAHLLPDANVLARLTDAERGYLVGRWYSLLFRMADRLRLIWEHSQFDRSRMIVKRGDDSSTWNAIAGAWNKAREHWVSLTYLISGETILNAVCPGKVMRLMAADVASWHRSSGGALHPDTAAWADLPAPWEVLTGKQSCGLREIRITCDSVGANYESWTFRKGRETVAFKPTPDLVHGVEVSSPELATMLRKAGVFSGKTQGPIAQDFDILRDEHGAAIEAVPAQHDWGER